jgi:hypothetical protein
MSKPVAWTDGKFCLSFAESDVCPIPLYTAPRELSDEEILEYVYAFSEQRCSIYSFQEDNILEMIRAILKKASEK